MIRKLTPILLCTFMIFVQSSYSQSANPNPQQAPSIPFAEVVLKDSTTLKGLFSQDPRIGTVLIGGVNDQGQKTTYFINPLSVETVNQVEVESSILQMYQSQIPNTQPQFVGVEIKVKDKGKESGYLIPSQNPLVVTFLPKDQGQPKSYPLAELDWFSQFELTQDEMAQAQQKIQELVQAQTQAAQKQLEDQQKQKVTQHKPQVMKITLSNDETLEGVVMANPQHQMLTVYSKNQNVFQIDFILMQFVKSTEAIETADEAIDELLNEQLQQPIGAKAYLLDGQMLKGLYAPQQMMGSYTIINQSTQQPAVIPANQVPRLTLRHIDTPIQEQGQGNPSTIHEGEKSSQLELDVRKTLYTNIPIQTIPDERPEHPASGSKIKLTTNLSQVFEGIVESINDNWLILSTTKIANFDLTIPQRSLINFNNVVALETIEST